MEAKHTYTDYLFRACDLNYSGNGKKENVLSLKTGKWKYSKER